MRILHLSTLDKGGAGDVAVWYNTMFKSLGYQSELVVRYSSSPDNGILSVDRIHQENSPAWIWRKSARKIKKLIRGIPTRKPETHFDYYFFQDETDEHISATKILSRLNYLPDVIFIYWTSEFITSRTINELFQKTGAKIYWLLMDNAPFTGGCHYPWDCKGFEQNCIDCPAFVSKKHSVLAARNLQMKTRFLPKNLTFIAFSEQDYQRALASRLGKERKVIKQLGIVDESKFKPGDKISAKSHFGIPVDHKVIFFGAAKMDEKRKGINLLMQSFSHIRDYIIENKVTLLCAGNSQLIQSELPILYTGYLNEEELIRAYQAADVFACPSIEDSGPMMINQAIMCGTPVVSYDCGVANDLVIDGYTGHKVPLNDYTLFGKRLKQILDCIVPEKVKLADHCRRQAVFNYGLSSLARLVDEITPKHEQF